MTDRTQTPFVHAWSDQAERERYLQHATEVYQTLKELRSDSRRYHVEYGKWLIASLLAIHGGAIYLISGLAQSDKAMTSSLGSAAALNVFGIVAILLAGGMAWINFQFAERTYDEWLDPAMLYRADCWPKHDEQRFNPIGATLWLAVAFGGLSIWSFIGSAIEVQRVIHGG